MNQSPGPTHALPPDMADVLYQCATTGQNVHVWFADDVPNDSVYISLRCPACARMHLVNRSGRTLMPPTPVRVGKILRMVPRHAAVRRRKPRPCPALPLPPPREVGPEQF
jgi:hypothetical protein